MCLPHGFSWEAALDIVKGEYVGSSARQQLELRKKRVRAID